MRARGDAPVPAGLALLLWLLLTALWWAPLDTRPLARPDEGRYAEIAREMAQTGDWVTPRLNGIKYFEKPPLQYWATASAYLALGVNERSARLWPLACGFLTLVLSAWIAVLSGAPANAALLAPLVLAGALYPGLLGHINTLDSGVTAFMTASLGCFLRARRSARSRSWMALAGACAGLAILSKGLIGVVLPGLALMLYTLLSRELSGWRRLHLPTAVGALLLVAAPWFVLCSWRNPEFAHFFFVHEHFERYTSTVHRRVEPAWYFLALLTIGLLPWTFALRSALVDAWRGRTIDVEGFRPLRFLLAYVIVVIAFFSASGSKLPTYILPAFPVLAVLLAHGLETRPQRARLALGAGALTLAVILLGAAVLLGVPGADAWGGVALDLDPDMVAPYAHLAPWLAAGAGALLVGLVVLVVAPPRQQLLGCGILALAGLSATVCCLQGAAELAPFNSTGPWSRTLAPLLPTGGRLFSVGTYDQTLDFYLQRTVILVDFLDELEFGLQQEPELALADIASFRATWGTRPTDRAIMEPARFAALQAAGLPMQVVARDARHVVVSPP